MTLRLAVLGDSIAHGQGARRPADALAPRLCEALRSRGYDVVGRVFAVRGARSSDLGRQVRLATAWHPDVALVVIGANDLTHGVAPQGAARDLGAEVRRLREGQAEVVVAPAPDMSIVPHVPGALRGLVRAGSLMLRERQIEAVLAAGGRVADLDGRTASAFDADHSLFSADRLHPSSAGYAAIAQALLPEVVAAVAAVDQRRAARERR